MNDNYKFFCDRVCSYIDHATDSEKRAIHKELSDHIEDHAQALMDLGRSEEEARIAAIVAMGDPEEIGREMNKEYPFIWLFLSRAAAVLAIILTLALLSPLRDVYYRLSDHFEAKNRPMEMVEGYENPIDIRVELPYDDIAYFFASDTENFADEYRANIGLVIYDKSPFGRVSQDALDFRLKLEDGFFLPNGGSFKGYAVQYKRITVAVKKYQESVELCYDLLGNEIWVQIPLNWEDVE